MTIVPLPGTTRRSAGAWAANKARTASPGTTRLNGSAQFWPVTMAYKGPCTTLTIWIHQNSNSLIHFLPATTSPSVSLSSLVIAPPTLPRALSIVPIPSVARPPPLFCLDRRCWAIVGARWPTLPLGMAGGHAGLRRRLRLLRWGLYCRRCRGSLCRHRRRRCWALHRCKGLLLHRRLFCGNLLCDQGCQRAAAGTILSPCPGARHVTSKPL